jgi:adenylate kinase
MEMHREHCRTFALALLLTTLTPAAAQMEPARIIILVGAPGSGKTIQAEYLHKRYQIPAISMAQLLQHEVNRKTTLGKALAASLASGELVTDDSANELMKARLLRTDARRGFILDGYPATEAQARVLDDFLSEHNFAKPAIVVIDAPDEVLRERMTRRRRADDDSVNIERRLREYHERGRLVERWYGVERVVRLDGTGAAADIAQRIASGLEAVQSRTTLTTRPAEHEALKPRRAAPQQK